MIRLPVRFGDKTKYRSLEVDFLVIDVPRAYNGQHDLMEIPKGVGAALLVTLLLSLDCISCSLLQLTLQPFLLGLTGIQIRLQSFAAPLVPRDEPLQPPALCNCPHPSSEDLGHGYFFRDHLGGIRSPRSCQVPGLNYVLDKRELGDRLAEGRRAGRRGRWPPGLQLLPLGKGRGCVPLVTGSPIGEGSIAQLSPPPLAMGHRPRPHPAVPWSSASSEPVDSQQASSRRAQGRVPTRKRLSLYIPRENESDELSHVPYLLGLLSNKVLPLFLSPAFGVSHLFGSGVPRLEDHQPCPRLICTKQKGSQGWAEAYHPRIYKTGGSRRSSARRPWVPRRNSARAFPHSTRPIVKAIPSQVPSLLGRLLNGKRYCFSRADLFNLVTTLGSEQVGAPGNLDLSDTISVTASARPFRLSTDLPGPNDASKEEGLVDALSEDELLEECLEEEPDEPVREEPIELQLVGGSDARSRLGLDHSANLEVSHIISYGDLPRIRHVHLQAKDAGGREILAAGPRGSGDVGNHPAINKGREIKELRGPGGWPTLNLPPGHLGSLGPPLHQPANKVVLPLVGSPCNPSKPQRLTTSDLPTMISYSQSYTREPRVARLPRSTAWRRMSPELFQEAPTQSPWPRLRPTKSAGIIRENLPKGGKAGAERSSNAR
ncbi:LOW QUALITY PROTEIN: hypothetical protein Cgig2_005209 [Carnegiea gigantea]|uniref:Uncharacterized protein n=1 Tax=Carnegiea gigantea TaxID=171969 RepID=A0A9Q1JTX9_9CARY|nr:LOW QUALITY PROTEIN: hypothetical protein Cgig2_005209 [Carnegiea gigantea]